MARRTPQILDGYLLYFTGTEWRHHAVGSTAWFAWLDQPTHRLFTYDGLAVRREVPKGKRQGFWYAYRKHQGRLAKLYLGKSDALTLAHLAAAAQHMRQKTGDAPALPPTATSRPQGG